MVSLIMGVVTLLPGAVEEFQHDFRSHILLPPAFQFFGPGVARFARLESCGLHVRLPAKRPEPQKGVGVTPRFAIAGDWEITLSYELFSVAKPLVGNGAGVLIYLEAGPAERPGEAALSAGHVLDVKGTSQYLLWYRQPAGEGEQEMKLLYFPARGQRGWLRLVRQGSSLAYFVAEESEKRFRQLASFEWVPHDLRAVRFVGNSGGSPTPVDVCLQQVVIRAEQLSNPRFVERQRTPRWLILSILLASLSFLGLVGYGLWRQRRARREEGHA
jgi:hypothetical protein